MSLFRRNDASLWRRKLARGLILVVARQSECVRRLAPTPQPGTGELRMQPVLHGRCQVVLYPMAGAALPAGRFTVVWDGPGVDGIAAELDVAAGAGWHAVDLVIPAIAERVWCRFASRDGCEHPTLVHWSPYPGGAQLKLLIQGILRRMPGWLRRGVQQVWIRRLENRKPTHPWSWEQITAVSRLDRKAMQQHAQAAGWDQARIRIWVDGRGTSKAQVEMTLQSISASAVDSLRPGVIGDAGPLQNDIPQVADIAEAVAVTTDAWLAIVPAGAELAASAGYWLAHAVHSDAELIFTDACDPQAWPDQGGMVLSGDFDPEYFRDSGRLPGLVCMRTAGAQQLTEPAGTAGWMSWVAAGIAMQPPTAIAHVDEVLLRLPEARHDGMVAQPLVPEGWVRVPLQSGEFSLRPQLPEPMPRVAVVIPTRDRVDLLRMCVGSLRALTAAPELEICIADNDSVEAETHAYFDELKAAGVRVLPCPGEFNFSRIVNRAVAATVADFVLLLNNDIEVTDPDWLQEMLAHAQRPEIGCVGAKLFFPDGRIQHAGVTIGLGGLAGHPMRFYPGDSAGYLNRLRHVQSYRAVTAACLLVRRSIYEQVGGFNETDLAVAYNDVDFCLRVEQAGYRNIWTPHARLIHHEYASRGLDIDPVKAARYARECEYLREHWGTQSPVDRYYHRLLTHADETCSLTPTPWGLRPWLVTICDDE